MMKKLSKRFLAMFMSILLLGFNSISTMAADKASVVYDTYNNFSYNLIQDNSKERVISYMENDMEVMIIYNYEILFV